MPANQVKNMQILDEKGFKDVCESFRKILKLDGPFTSALEELAEVCLNNGADIDYCDGSENSQYQFTALEEAINLGDMRKIVWLSKNGADFNLERKNGQTPLLWIITRWNKNLKKESSEYLIEIIDCLITNGADPNFINQKFSTPLVTAIGIGYFPIMELLLQKGAKINFSSQNVFTPLVAAVSFSDCGMIKFLLKQGAEINKIDENGATALMAALRINDYQKAKLLIDNGADPLLCKSVSETPLTIARETNNNKLVRLIKDAIAKKKAQPVYVAPKPVPVLQKSKEELQKEKNKEFRIALRIGNLDRAKKCLDAGANVDYYDGIKKSPNEFTALEEAILLGNLARVVWLVSKRASLNISPNPLLLAVELGKESIALYLMGMNADINFASKEDGTTALHMAMKQNHQNIARMLIEKDAALNKDDASGFTALDYADNTKDEKWISELVSKGLKRAEDCVFDSKDAPIKGAKVMPPVSAMQMKDFSTKARDIEENIKTLKADISAKLKNSPESDELKSLSGRTQTSLEQAQYIKEEISKFSKSPDTTNKGFEELDKVIEDLDKKREFFEASKPKENEPLGEVDKIIEDSKEGKNPRSTRKREWKYPETSTPEEWAEAKEFGAWAERFVRKQNVSDYASRFRYVDIGKPVKKEEDVVEFSPDVDRKPPFLRQ